MVSGNSVSQGRVGVAISTTGDEHRFDTLLKCVTAWVRALDDADPLVVTVDGDVSAVFRVLTALSVAHPEVAVYQVGQPTDEIDALKTRLMRDGRLGVATNKNTGIELLMDAGVDHLFLSDDDTWPLSRVALELHIGGVHSMVCWGKHRLQSVADDANRAEWSWPRGVMLYTRREVVEVVGGMDERFGPGGHEHVEWSRRIYQNGFTPAPFITPRLYATEPAQGFARTPGFGALNYWHCEDAPRPGEPLGNLRLRKRRFTSVRRVDGDWEHIEKIMAERDGDTSFVPYTASANGRASATLFQNL